MSWNTNHEKHIHFQLITLRKAQSINSKTHFQFFLFLPQSISVFGSFHYLQTYNSSCDNSHNKSRPFQFFFCSLKLEDFPMSKRVTFARVFYLQASPVFLVQWSQVPACHEWFSDFFWNAPLQELKYSLFPMPHNFYQSLNVRKDPKCTLYGQKRPPLNSGIFSPISTRCTKFSTKPYSNG